LRVCLDTNIIVSGLASPNHPPARLLELWLQGRFTLVTSEWQLQEFRRVSRYARIRARVPAHVSGQFVNTARSLAIVLTELNQVQASPDPDDDFILATAVTGRVDALVTGDTADVLFLQKIGQVRIMTARALLDLLEPPQKLRARKR
jgi:uncharacterized protein